MDQRHSRLHSFRGGTGHRRPGGIAVASQEIQVVGKSVQVSEATVRDGGYSLLVHAREGHVFSGLVISFRVGDTLAKQTAKWQQGGGDEVNLVFTP